MEIRAAHGTIGQILQNEQLAIPAYQRPYKWQRKQIRNLFYDAKEAQERENYQLGSLIVHQTSQSLDVVDGQQRLISIALFLYALERLDDFAGAKQLLSRETDELSIQNAQENLKEWRQLISLDENQAQQICDFLLNHCQIFMITMPENRLSEAFQLFDSQNNRGKSLEPHDLLKAYHLRKIETPTEETVAAWERIVSDDRLDLKTLFDRHLFRMRRWSRGETGLTKRRYGPYLRFTEDYLDDFKGVNLTDNYPYLELYRMVENIPHSLTMPIINGQAFFDYIYQSHQAIKAYQELALTDYQLSEDCLALLKSPLHKMRHPKNLFDNCLLLFIDRFGYDEVTKEVLETIFIWAFYPRAKQKRLYETSLANYAAGGKWSQKNVQKLFQLMSNSISPTDFLQKINRDQFEHWTVADLIREVNKNGK